MVDRKAIFDRLRAGILGPTLDQGEVDGVTAILNATAGWPADWQAYALATTYHETAGAMRPITEYGSQNYFNRRYGPEGDNPALAKRLGNVKLGDGARYAGRGFVQITGRANYKRLGDVLGVDLENQPGVALRPDIAAKILRFGMERGLFTGRKLADYFGGGKRDPVQARKIINGLDKASKIAGYFERFREALS